MAKIGVEIKAIQVTFNVLDPEQRRFYEHAYSKTNSSGYIKRLIDRDMTSSQGMLAPVQQPIIQDRVESFEFDAGGFI